MAVVYPTRAHQPKQQPYHALVDHDGVTVSPKIQQAAAAGMCTLALALALALVLTSRRVSSRPDHNFGGQLHQAFDGRHVFIWTQYKFFELENFGALQQSHIFVERVIPAGVGAILSARTRL